jgi:putative phage-type endonuclease
MGEEIAGTTRQIVQGSPEWHELRLGKITASRFADILTEPKSKGNGKLSKTAHSYLCELVGEHLTGRVYEQPQTRAMQWGHEWEPIARHLYGDARGIKVQEVGFVTHPAEPMIGGSPDGLCGDGGGLEIKCPATVRVHVSYILGGELPREHIPQVQGQIWLNDWDWCDFVSYYPHIDDFEQAMWIHRAEPDHEYIRNLERKVFAFRDVLLETLIALKTGGRL